MKNFVINAVLLVASVSLCLLVAEGFFRLQGYGSAGERDGNRVHHVVPGQFDHYALLNSLDLRDREVLPKRSDEYRILIIGDSFTYGLGVHGDETFVHQVERFLARDIRCEGSVRRIRVINGGVGLGPVKQFNWLTATGLSLQPDLVVQAFFIGNDIYDDLRSVRHSERSAHPADDRRLKTLIRSSVFLDWLLNRLTTIRIFDELMFKAGLRHSYRGLYLKNMPDTEKKAWKLSLQTLDHTKDLLNRSGIAYQVIIVPTNDQVRYGSKDSDIEDYKLPNSILREFLSSRSIPYVDLLPVFEKSPEKRKLYFSRNLHWTAFGHYRAAQVIATKIRQDSPLHFICDERASVIEE